MMETLAAGGATRHVRYLGGSACPKLKHPTSQVRTCKLHMVATYRDSFSTNLQPMLDTSIMTAILTVDTAKTSVARTSMLYFRSPDAHSSSSLRLLSMPTGKVDFQNQPLRRCLLTTTVCLQVQSAAGNTVDSLRRISQMFRAPWTFMADGVRISTATRSNYCESIGTKCIL